jgi:hypothetical protein
VKVGSLTATEFVAALPQLAAVKGNTKSGAAPLQFWLTPSLIVTEFAELVTDFNPTVDVTGGCLHCPREPVVIARICDPNRS